MLDLTPLSHAIHQLELALRERTRQPSNDFIRDALVQRFEFTYELCHKMLRRFLIATEAEGETIREMSFPDLIRRAWERKLLLNGWDRWKDYREARNIVSHTYDRAKAETVAAIVSDFYHDAQWLLDHMAARSNA